MEYKGWFLNYVVEVVKIKLSFVEPTHFDIYLKFL